MLTGKQTCVLLFSVESWSAPGPSGILPGSSRSVRISSVLAVDVWLCAYSSGELPSFFLVFYLVQIKMS